MWSLWPSYSTWPYNPFTPSPSTPGALVTFKLYVLCIISQYLNIFSRHFVWGLQNRLKHKVYIYLESELGSPHPLYPQASVPLHPEPKGEGIHSTVGEGVGGTQFGRLKKKPSTLSTLWAQEFPICCIFSGDFCYNLRVWFLSGRSLNWSSPYPSSRAKNRTENLSCGLQTYKNNLATPTPFYLRRF